MPIIHQTEDGKELELHTPEELENAKAEAVKPLTEELGKTKEEVEHLKKVSAEKSENIKKLRDMSDEEKKALDVNTITILKKMEALEEESNQTKAQLAEKNEKERNYTKDTILGSIHSGDEKVKLEIETAYGQLNMPETTPAEIRARADAAMRLAGIAVKTQNPLYGSFSGEAPNIKSEKDKEFTETERGKALYEQLNNKQ